MASAVKCLSVSSCWWPAGTIFLKSVLRNGMRGKQLLGESLKVTSPIFRGSSRGYFSVYLSDIIHDIIERNCFDKQDSSCERRVIFRQFSKFKSSGSLVLNCIFIKKNSPRSPTPATH